MREIKEAVEKNVSPFKDAENYRKNRRALIKTGLISIPVVMTVVSRPVLAFSSNGAGDYGSYAGDYSDDTAQSSIQNNSYNKDDFDISFTRD